MAAEDAQEGRDQDEPDEHRVQEDGDAEDDAHLFGGRGPERAKVKKTATITAAAAKMTRPDGRGRRWLPRGGRVSGPSAPCRGEQEHGVVHRDREDHREEEDGRPGVHVALRFEAEQAGAVPVLEDQPSYAEGCAGCEQVGEHAERREERSLQSDQQQQEAEHENDADHEWCLCRKCSFEVVVLGCGTADERAWGRVARSRSIVRPTAAARRVGVRDRLNQCEPVRAELRCRDAGDAGVAACDRKCGAAVGVA